MNERIQALAIQAAGKGFQTFATSDLDSPEKIELFAKLIVRECIDICKDVNRNPYIDDEYQARQIIKNITKHFGVEE